MAGTALRQTRNRRQKRKAAAFAAAFFGGDKRDRTADLLTASQALSQLSYTPEPEHLVV